MAPTILTDADIAKLDKAPILTDADITKFDSSSPVGGTDITSQMKNEIPIQNNKFQVKPNILAPDTGQNNTNTNIGILKDIFSHPLANSSVISDAISNSGKQIVNNFADLGDNTINSIKNIPQLPGQLLNSLLHPILTGKAIGGAIGNKLNEYNTMDKFSTKVSSEPLAFGNDVVNSALLAKGLIASAPQLGKLKVLMPKAYNDAFINSTGQSAVSKIQGAITPLKLQYKTLTEPFLEKPVSGEDFQKALSVVPKGIQQDFIDKYGSLIIDENGKPTTTVGNLQKMELGIKDDIQQPKYGQSINAASYNYAEAAKKIKQVRLSQYPKSTQDAIGELDKKFGPVINMTDYLLPRISNQAGVINSKFLYQVFNNPTDAGTRQYLSGLTKLGVDLSPEIKTLKGWVGRQRTKSFVKSMTGKGVEGAALGTIFRGSGGGG